MGCSMSGLDRWFAQGPAQAMQRWFARTVLVLIVTVFILFDVAPGGAQSDDNAALRNEVGEMRQTIDSLNRKVHDLEQKLADRPPATPETVPTPPEARATGRQDAGERWGDVKRGMSKAEVGTLLGQPDRTMDVSTRTVWYYQYNNMGSGSVVFADDGSVIDWQKPPFATWWW
jgi:hypothetical protein